MSPLAAFPRLPDIKPRFGRWWTGITVGIRTVGREPMLGLKRLRPSLSYSRTVEFGCVVDRHDGVPCGARLLGLRSKKALSDSSPDCWERT